MASRLTFEEAHRFLAEHLAPRPSHLAPRLIGVCFPFQRVAVVPVDAHDVVLDQIFC